MSKSSLAIIVPLYNPHNDWFDAICDTILSLDKTLTNIDYTIVLVNDGSTQFDESSIEKLKTKSQKVHYISNPVNQGKGFTIRHGLSKVEADFYIYTDIDFPFGHTIIHEMCQIFHTKSPSLIIGIRGKEYFKMLPLRRKILSKALHNVNYILTGFKVHDTQAGIKGFDNEAKKIFLATKTNEFLFDLEFIRGCLQKKLHYTTVNVHPRPNIRFSDFRNTVVKKEIKNLIKILFRF